MKNVLFVAHRYAPYPGGTEYNVQRMAESLLENDHNVWVLADTHKGNYNGVGLTSDYNLLMHPDWDLIAIHGYGPTQAVALTNAHAILAKKLYMIIDPESNPHTLFGMEHCDFLGWATSFDLHHINAHGYNVKAHKIRYAVNEGLQPTSIDFRKKYNITTRYMYLSCGGFWTHKRMPELVQAFEEANVPDTTLVLAGYDNRDGWMPVETDRIKVIFQPTQEEVYAAMLAADLYIMNSQREGYGIVILEAMFNKTEWIARDIAAAHDLQEYGTVYTEYNQLVSLLRSWKPNPIKIEAGYQYVMHNHLSMHIRNDLEKLL
jgi:glycosyltransferase involved in cell wall biosynthesis